MVKIPWDLNNTLGDIYQNAAVDTNHTNDHEGDFVYGGVCEVLLSSGDPDVIAAI